MLDHDVVVEVTFGQLIELLDDTCVAGYNGTGLYNKFFNDKKEVFVYLKTQEILRKGGISPTEFRELELKLD
ncbi:MAG: hypothetical protein FNT15_05915 [Sulfurovum sp.]|nr:MAG: hypothetical protein FNT15_05915 [Sulfurovum sp.]